MYAEANKTVLTSDKTHQSGIKRSILKAILSKFLRFNSKS